MAEQWWKIELGPNGPIGSIRQQFLEVFAVTGVPRGAALFCGPTPESGAVVYFSPKAAIVASFILEANRGVPCDRPAEGVFLAGQDADRALIPAPTRR
jgi:hypothetical protein